MTKHLTDNALTTRASQDFYNSHRSHFGEFVKAELWPLTSDNEITLRLTDRDGGTLSLMQTNIGYSGTGPLANREILVAEGFGDDRTIGAIVHDPKHPVPITLTKSL